MTYKIDWNNIGKLRIANPDDSFQHHEVVKLLLMMKLQKKYKSNSYWIRIYTEFTIKGNKKADVFFENIKTHEQYAYEIQKSITDKWLEETKKSYKNYQPMNFTFDYIIIPLKELSTDINILNKQLDKYVI